MASEPVFHPAAEIVAIALKKICKVANSRKYSKLHEECRLFLDELHLIIPAAGTAGGTRLLVYGRSDTGSTTDLASQAAATAATSRRASVDGRSAAAAPTPTPPPEEENPGAVTPKPPATDEAQAGTPGAPEDAAAQQAAQEAATPAADGQDAAAPPPDAAAEAPPGASSQPDAAAPAAAVPPPAPARPPPPPEPELPDLVPRTATALPDPVCDRILGIFRLAVDTQRPEVIEVALDCIQKLVAFRFMQGAVYAVNAERAPGAGKDGEDGESGQAGNAGAHRPQAQAIELICKCDEIPDDKVELQILKNLLTATTSTTFTVHGQALLLAVRTCYNIFLMSRSDVNQQTAKATLTQMLNVVFQRMEADSVFVEVRPIMVTDVLGLPKTNPSDVGSLTSVVQSFLNNVVMVTAGMGQQQAPNVDEVRSSVSAAVMDARGAPALGLAADPPLPSPVPSAPSTSSAIFKPSTSGIDLAGEGAAASGGSGGDGAAALEEAAGGAVLPAASGSGAAAGGKASEGGSGMPAVADAASRTAVLQRDAFLVFRALCKLSIRTNDATSANDPSAIRGKVLALELVKVLLENSGPVFRRADKFLAAIRQYLCLSLLKNSASSLPAAQALCVSIFMSLLTRFRASLKAEVGVFFPMILLKPLEGPAGPPQGIGPGAPQPQPLNAAAVQHKGAVLRAIKELTRDGQLLLDIFVNFDCDLESSNLFERLINSLVRQAQQPVQTPSSQGLAGLPGLADGSASLAAAEQGLRQEALVCLVNAMEAIWTWYRHACGLADPVTGARRAGGQAMGAAEDDTGDDADLAAAAAAAEREARAAAAAEGGAAAGATGGPGGQDDLVAKRAYKLKFQQGIALFNKKPKKGIEFLQREGMLGSDPAEVAAFLSRTEGLDKITIGDYLGEREENSLKVMHAYVDAMDFTSLEFDTAIRIFLQGFRLPGEAQKIDRLMEKFAERFVKCNPGSFKAADVAYVLAYSVIMLNTDAHNPQVKNKMSKAAFLKNNRGINDGADLPEDFMGALYDRIVTNEIKMNKDDGGAGAAGGAAAQQDTGIAAPARALFNTLLGLMGGRGPAVSAGPSDAAIRATLDYLHQRAASATTVTVTEADAVRPLMEVVWAPLLGALSTMFDEYGDARLVTTCLAGFASAACLAAQTGMTHLRDVFLNALCNFTHLHSPGTMRHKNALAFKYLLRVAETVGDQLQERWVDVLRCISRWELLQQIASGMPTDAALFRQPEEKGLKAAAAALGQKLRNVANEIPGMPRSADLADSFFHPPTSTVGGGPGPGFPSSAVPGGLAAAASAASSSSAAGTGSYARSSTSSSVAGGAHDEATIKRVHIGGSAMFGHGGKGAHHGHHGQHHPHDPLSVPAEVINSVDSGDLNRVFLTSGQLNSEAIVEFVRALTAVSYDELRDARAPRVFSLTKIVEVAHFNMTRIRLVWSRIWAVLSEYFIAVGCHSNLPLAMYAVDALRQLAMKFLERDELANYTFQNDFLRPFVVVMRKSQAVEIRELIIRCLSQMILARVTNVKSGWKSMFMVFTTAANDRDPMIVRLAFDTIEKIVREHFTHITETETTTFTDCVNCLIAFTNNPHSLDVALNSIAFLRFCAMKLAEGAIGDVNMLPEGTLPPQALQHHPLRVVAIDNNPEASTSFARGGDGAGGQGASGGGAAGSSAGGGGGGGMDSISRESSAEGLPGPAGLPEQPGTPQPGRVGSGGEAEGGDGDRGRANGAEASGRPPGTPASPFGAASGHATAAAGTSVSAARPSEPGRTPLTTSASHAHRPLRFIDRDEHVYFWFPLLAGLSELTFDPRQEIRHSALEVLFDILRYHGGSFAQSFWVRIFDSVLLPIFDHVRAEVTDATTFTSEKRRQQEEQWLYETCTRCLQHLVDLFVQFYDEAFTLLSRLLDLLRGFMNRSHQSLAAVGVAAFVRLAVNAGPIMNETCWEMVIASLLAILEETAPEVRDLITPPQRLAGAASALPGGVPVPGGGGPAGLGSEITPVAPSSYGSGGSGGLQGPGTGSSPPGGGMAVGPPGGGGGGSGPGVAASGGSGSSSGAAGRAFTLREGVGARRLAKFRCQAATQLLLVQGCSEIYAKASQSLPPGAVRGLLDALAAMHRHAHAADMDMDLRRRLAVQQAEDRVAEDKAVADPPLLRLEVEAAAAYLSVNMAITAAANAPGASPDAVALARLTNAQERLVRLCLSTLSRYTLGVRHELHHHHHHPGGPGGPPEGASVAAAAPPPPRDRPRLLGFLPGRGGGAPPPPPSMLPQPRYIVVGRTAGGAPVLMAPPAVEFASFSPLALSSLCALGELEEATFRKYVAELFPLLTQLIRADYAPADVHRALSTLFARRVQPMVLAVAGGPGGAAALGLGGAAPGAAGLAGRAG
ncbi:hypothetical protein HYH02_002496 [Chlamydomonas schloesseri]|uniref:SEC7 domain-containing protein n=1 Tax=Chlamydomonas schloesseri TaxID=2026947 RepID=A0A836BB18_9CHLO|nr:hypothetical protein HYH02_002496 [Chlamydomonas schloesseri]|eukprot:KAG2453172.1 hypothetical protein HYH02_002496 [Chlamydomonas schloesseri]